MKKVFFLESKINGLSIIFSSEAKAQEELKREHCILNIDNIPNEVFRESLFIYPRFVF